MREITGLVLLLAIASCQKKSTQEKQILILGHKNAISLDQELLSITKVRSDIACIPENAGKCGSIQTVQYQLDGLPAEINVSSLGFSENSHSFPTHLSLRLPNGFQFKGVNHTSRGKNSFQVLQEIGGHIYSTDGVDLYCKKKLVEQRLPVENIQFAYGYNDDGVWYHCEETSLKLDQSSIEILGWNFLKNKNSVVFTNRLLEGADPESFKLLNNYYQQDKLRAYYQGSVIEGIDSLNFEALEHSHYAKNDSKVFYYGNEIEADATSFSYLGTIEEPISDWEAEVHSYAKDVNHIYQDDKVLEGVDPNTIANIADLIEYLAGERE